MASTVRRGPGVREVPNNYRAQQDVLQAEKKEHSSNVVLLWRSLKNVVSLKSPTFQVEFLFKLELEVNILTGGTPRSFERIRKIHTKQTKQSTQVSHPPSDELRTF